MFLRPRASARSDAVVMSALYPRNVDFSKSTIGGLPLISQFVNHQGMSDTAPFVEIGQRLEAIRQAFSDLSQKDWAERHSFSASTYNNWVKGIRRIPVENAERLCDLYGLDLDFIYRGKRDGLSENSRKVL